MRYIGIDYGTKRIGIAYSNEEGTIAMPLTVIENGKEALEEVVERIKEKKGELVVLGESVNADGRPNPVMEKIEAFKKDLEEEGFKVEYEKEFFTSAHVEHKNDQLDASAAALILQRYLDRNTHGNNR